MMPIYDEEGDEIEGFPYPKDNVCEECGEECAEESSLFDAIIYGKNLKVCDKCAKLCGALIIQKPTKDQIEKSKRPSTRDAMRRATGIDPKKADKADKIINSLTLEDMRKRANALKEKKEKEKQAEREAKEKEEKIFKKKESGVLEEKEFLDYLESQVEEMKEEEKTQNESK